MPIIETTIGSTAQQVTIGRNHPIVIIGERINPTGRAFLAQALSRGDMSVVQRDAIAQMQAGADILDVNVGVPGQDEATLMASAVQAITQVCPLPLCIDSANPEALKAGLAAYEGRALVNSVNGETRSLAQVLPLVKAHGAAVIALTMDDDGIPPTAGGRLRVADLIVNRAQAEGIPLEDVIIDPLAMTVGADGAAPRITLDAMRLIRERLGVNMTLGTSNVSHGLPDRPTLNAVFVSMAIACGVTCPIVNPLDDEVRDAVRAADLLMGHDEWAMRWIKNYRKVSSD